MMETENVNCPVCWRNLVEVAVGCWPSACKPCWRNRVEKIRQQSSLPIGQQVFEQQFFCELHTGWLSLQSFSTAVKLEWKSNTARTKLNPGCNLVDVQPINTAAASGLTGESNDG